ncbi:MAG: Type 1 glutamine amidotransferase-like domain-containing protein [Crocinitomicaceae bacterium]|nr:Type 1 glutamine amidotransferase-like domain-containing protein [Crocinitomicaceae bacterium]MDG1776318.1 Type 1 glutamine amidotransferase-like domain-containing protein [Crocinitomicaceae bacterium]
MRLFLLIALLLSSEVYAQLYTSYFTGNPTNMTSANPQGGTCMMGGAAEHDEAMKWFLQRADGGDVLVLRTSGSNGYNNYLYTDLGVSVNSVETIVFNNPNAANESYIHDKIRNAEAIWFAGGNQWSYISYWRNTPIDSLINDAIQNRNIVVGGTSAGMAILSNYYFSASNGTVTSSTALNNPYDSDVTVDSTEFLNVDFMHDVITDTHYDDPDRKGRHVVFLARILTDYGIAAKGIACNEYTAVCVDENGLARVYGDYPAYPETAFFLQTNCELSDYNPENCSNSTPLNWNLNGTAVKVYKVNGTNNGNNTFDLSDWETGNGGTWENWYVDNGTLVETTGTQINCSEASLIHQNWEANISVYPNPFDDILFIESDLELLEFELLDINGKLLQRKENLHKTMLSINKTTLRAGVYLLKVKTREGFSYFNVLKK